MRLREELKQMLGALQDVLPVTSGATDRRGTDRFPITRELRYKLLSSKGRVELGVGQTLDISSSGVLFAAETPLAPGKRVEVSISWPAQLDGKCALKLVARGRVKRCRGTQVALEIDKYEFRTQGTKGLVPQAGS
jgi:hypothetical protein